MSRQGSMLVIGNLAEERFESRREFVENSAVDFLRDPPRRLSAEAVAERFSIGFQEPQGASQGRVDELMMDIVRRDESKTNVTVFNVVPSEEIGTVSTAVLQ